jgi:(3,5-dihydroxyphenyl)acetyl-CoA 1,2-dioxygenase
VENTGTNGSAEGTFAALHPLGAPIEAWTATDPIVQKDYGADSTAFSRFWQSGLELLAKLGPKPKRNAAEEQLAAHILAVSRSSRHRFLHAHARALYEDLTAGRSRHIRVDGLAYAAAARIPALVPTRQAVEEEATHLQKEKDGHEIDQGILLNHFLADRSCGLHLCHAMLRPHPDSAGMASRLDAEGRIAFGAAILERRGKASFVYLRNPRYLNAEDNTTLDDAEKAADLAMLDPQTEICVLRGAAIEGGKYQGQNVFCSGINLTHLYQGKIPYLWYITRDMGIVNKFFRGLAGEALPDDELGETIEKPWVAAVEKFAIGGGCQYLLTMDYVLAASDAYMTLPARKEGIIPGAANMRLPRFVGDRIARQAIMYDRRIDCDSPEGRMICDEIASPAAMEAALGAVLERLTSSGVVSVASNRRAFRIVQEPLDLFRSYMAVYAREQAYCHFSPALIHNLELYWNADKRAA